MLISSSDYMCKYSFTHYSYCRHLLTSLASHRMVHVFEVAKQYANQGSLAKMGVNSPGVPL